eukprot:scaffold5122_cov120-Isochrysis_galbana.AAC.6
MASAADGADRPPIEQLDAEICAALEELASQLRCKACQQSFRDPYTLPCGHRFCRCTLPADALVMCVCIRVSSIRLNRVSAGSASKTQGSNAAAFAACPTS